MEKESKESIISRPEFQKFIKGWKIDPEDFAMIEKLVSFPQDLIILEFHNLFNSSRERSVQQLEQLIESAKDKEKKDLYEAALSFVKKYNWGAAQSLTRLLEGEY